MRHTEHIRAEVCYALSLVSGTEYTEKVREYAQYYDVSVSTIYRWSQSPARRSSRSDRGSRRTPISTEVLSKMFALSVQFKHPAHVVIARAEDDGLIAPGAISVSTYNAYLRRAGIPLRSLKKPRRMTGVPSRAQQKSPIGRRFQAVAANRVHQIDVTELPRHFIRGDNTIGFDPTAKVDQLYRDTQPRAHLFVMVDDYSRVTYAYIYRSKDAECWLDFMMRAWSEKPNHAHFPFRGLPDVLYGDSDSATKSLGFRRLISELGVEFRAHRVENPASKGKVERGGIAFLKAYMERALREEIARGNTLSTEGANEMLSDILYLRNGRPHTETGQPPIQRWVAGLTDPIRMPPSGAGDWIHYISVTRLLRSDLTVKMHGETIQLPRREPFLTLAAQKVRIEIQHHSSNWMHHPFLIEIEGETHTVDPEIARPDTAGDWKSLPKSRAERVLEEAYEAELPAPARDMWKGRYAKLMFPAHESPAPPPPAEIPPVAERQTLTKIAVKTRLVRGGFGIDHEKIEEVFGDRKKISETDYESIERTAERKESV